MSNLTKEQLSSPQTLMPVLQEIKQSPLLISNLLIAEAFEDLVDEIDDFIAAAETPTEFNQILLSNENKASLINRVSVFEQLTSGDLPPSIWDAEDKITIDDHANINDVFCQFNANSSKKEFGADIENKLSASDLPVGFILDDLGERLQTMLDNAVSSVYLAVDALIQNVFDQVNLLRMQIVDDVNITIDRVNEALSCRIRQIENIVIELEKKLINDLESITNEFILEFRQAVFNIPILGGVAQITDLVGSTVSPLITDDHEIVLKGVGIGTPSTKFSSEAILSLTINDGPFTCQGVAKSATEMSFQVPYSLLSAHWPDSEKKYIKGEISLIVTKKRTLWWPRKSELKLPFSLLLYPKKVGNLNLSYALPIMKWKRSLSTDMVHTIATPSGHPKGKTFSTLCRFSSIQPPSNPPKKGDVRIVDIVYEGCSGHPCNSHLNPIASKMVNGASGFITAVNWSHSVRLTYRAITEKYSFDKSKLTTTTNELRLDRGFKLKIPHNFMTFKSEGIIINGIHIIISASRKINDDRIPDPVIIGPLSFVSKARVNNDIVYIFKLSLLD